MKEQNEKDYRNENPDGEKAQDHTDNISQEENEEMADLQNREKAKSSLFNKKHSGKDEKLKEKVLVLEDENRELGDRFLRLYSEFDNYKKRTQKEKLELIETASERVLSEMLPIIDDFERAIKANENVQNIDTIKEGFILIYHKLIKLLERNNVNSFGEISEEFDTDKHEAIAHVPVSEEDKGKVIDVTQKGYRIKDKIIRYAKVVVGN